MKRALAFCKDIATSKLVQNEFAAVITEYLASDEGREAEGDAQPLECQLEHVDGTFNAKARTRLLDWLKEDHGNHACRILTNARCLSEGVDVPALDAILFMHPRKSQIDVVQSVGRVMRRSPGKNMGYVILPIGVPAGMTPEEALNDNERYRVVWQILNALRSHDERFDAMINKADLGVDVSDHIEVIAVSNKLPTKKGSKGGKSNIGHGSAADDDDHEPGDIKPSAPVQGAFFFDEFSKAIMAKIVKKCGRRDYWEDWATDIAKIAQTHITRITALVASPDRSEPRSKRSLPRSKTTSTTALPKPKLSRCWRNTLSPGLSLTRCSRATASRTPTLFRRRCRLCWKRCTNTIWRRKPTASRNSTTA
jgi:predicted helicase